MVRASRLIGLPVISLERETKIGITKEVWLSLDLRSVVGLVVGLRRLLASSRFVRFSELFSLTSSSVTIRDEAVLGAAKESEVDGIGLQSVVSTVIRTRDGSVVGSLSDLFLDENTGQVLEFEVSEGIIEDITKGRTRVVRPECTSFNGLVITLADDAVQRQDTRS
ncbi:MAG: hypothetical protein GXX08_03015 [Firmicutes bacterium]|nr:hypothetical protein [Bacillota bacterium]